MRRALLVAALLATGCPRAALPPVVDARAALVEAPAWRSQTAEHRVTVTVRLDGGAVERRSLRGVIAIERPGRLRLRALGPAGITLFDLLVTDGTPRVIAAIRRPSDGPGGQALDNVIASLAQDLACAYDLQPRAAGRTVKLEGKVVVVEEPGRTVRLSHFAGAPAIWRHAEIHTDQKNAKYDVTVDVEHVEVDPALDPSLFAD
jgi:hypothetical protein